MTYKSDRIVIVGGGSAGWMTAATLIKNYPNKQIFVVESDAIPTIGVGESTLLEFNDWLKNLEIDQDEFMRETEAAYKFGIGFTDFADLGGERLYYIFGAADTKDTMLGISDWYLLKAKNPDLPYSDFTDYYWTHSHSVKVNKIPYEDSSFLSPFKFKKDTAFQVNAIKLAEWLREKYCIPRGVKRIIGTVSSVKENEDGIECLLLSNGESIYADLFVDCSGFKSILLGKVMQPKFIHTKENLPNNKAWFGPIQYTDKEKELELYTNCTGLKNGWVWNTPLWSRIGSGYVYCDDYVDDDTALEEFKNHLDSKKMTVYDPHRSEKMDFKKIEIKNGYYETPWIKNVVAIGLSHGFLEPMESTGLMFIHLAASLLVRSLVRGRHTRWDIDRFNYTVDISYKSAFSFVSAHYALSLRDDSPYWRDLTSQAYDKSMHDDVKESFGANISQVYTGWGHLEKTKLSFQHMQRDIPQDIFKSIDMYENMRRRKIRNAIDFIEKSPTHYQYLKENIHER